MRSLVLAVILCSALSPFLAGCAPQGAITAPDLEVRLPRLEPVAVVAPLVSVYRAIPYETVLDLEKEKAVSKIALEAVRQLLAKRGWQTLVVAPIDFDELLAGYPLSNLELQSLAGDEKSKAFAEALQQLDRIGQRLRVRHPGEGYFKVEEGVSTAPLVPFAPRAASFLFLSITGCFGRLSEGPCRNIQFPQPIHTFDTTEFTNVQTVPFGMAIHLYWLDAATGRLLWYNDFSRHNLNPGYGKDVKVLVEKVLVEFPSQP